MKARKKSVILFHIVFLLFTLSLSACGLVSGTRTEESTESYVMPYKVVHGIPCYIAVTLGDLVQDYPTIAYGTILDKSEFAEAPKPLLYEQAQAFEMCQKVTMKVKRGIRGCEDGDTITYWEIGGMSEDGIIYKLEGYDKSQVGETVLVFLDPDRLAFYVQLQADSEGNISLSGDFMTEEPCDGAQPENEASAAELPMEEYLDKVEKVVREQKD